jgi:hypothetical protein
MNSVKSVPTDWSNSGEQLTRYWLFCTIVALALSFSLHLLFFTILRLPDTVFLGSLTNPDDFSVYLAAMRQGGEGNWLFQVTFTPEPIQPKLTYLPYMLLGRLAAALNAANASVFHLARGLGGFLTLWAVYYWLRLARLDAGIVKDSFVLIALGGGLGWLFLLFGVISPDLGVAEWTVFLSLAYAPHFIMAIGAEILIFIGLLQIGQRDNPQAQLRLTTLTLTGAMGIALLYPFEAAPIMLIIALFSLDRLWRNGHTALSQLWPAVLPTILLLFWSGYYALIARADPYWETTHVAQNVIPSPDLFALIGGLGLPGILAAITAAKAVANWRQSSRFVRVAVIWFGVNLIFLYLPVPFQGRFSLGLYVPTAVLAVIGLHQHLLPWLIRRYPHKDQKRLATLLRYGLIVPSLLATFTALSVYFLAVQQLPQYFWRPTAEVTAGEWLAAHSDESALILTSVRTGNYLPRVVSGRVFQGHVYTTVDLESKEKLVNQFFDESTSDEWRRDFLQQWEISHIYYGQFEKRLGPMPDNLPVVKLYDQDDILIFRLE